MKRLSLQWRITIMTALLTCAACMLTNCLVGYTGMRYMDAIGSGISALSTADEDTPQAFDPTNVALDDEVTVVGITHKSLLARPPGASQLESRCLVACWHTL